jgi:hypothetical protein
VRRTRRVAQLARQVGFGQPERGSDSLIDAQADHESRRNPSSVSLDSPDSPIPSQPYTRRTESDSNQQDASKGEITSSHVNLTYEADQTDQTDQGRNSAGLRGGPQADHRLTDDALRLTTEPPRHNCRTVLRENPGALRRRHSPNQDLWFDPAAKPCAACGDTLSWRAERDQRWRCRTCERPNAKRNEIVWRATARCGQ